MGYLSPNDQWPAHSRPEARAALKDAAAAGWHFRKGGSHSHVFGIIKCTALGEPGACTLVVYSTPDGPADGSETAKRIRSMLRKCPHQRGADSNALDKAPRLSDAELERNVLGLLEAIDGLAQRDRAEAGMHGAVETDDDDALDEAEERWDRGDSRARSAWAQLGRPLDPWPPSVAREELLAEAERLAEAINEPAAAGRLLQLVRDRRS